MAVVGTRQPGKGGYQLHSATRVPYERHRKNMAAQRLCDAGVLVRWQQRKLPKKRVFQVVCKPFVACRATWIERLFERLHRLIAAILMVFHTCKHTRTCE